MVLFFFEFYILTKFWWSLYSFLWRVLFWLLLATNGWFLSSVRIELILWCTWLVIIWLKLWLLLLSLLRTLVSIRCVFTSFMSVKLHSSLTVYIKIGFIKEVFSILINIFTMSELRVTFIRIRSRNFLIIPTVCPFIFSWIVLILWIFWILIVLVLLTLTLMHLFRPFFYNSASIIRPFFYNSASFCSLFSDKIESISWQNLSNLFRFFLLMLITQIIVSSIWVKQVIKWRRPLLFFFTCTGLGTKSISR